jgi:hypothetical protein
MKQLDGYKGPIYAVDELEDYTYGKSINLIDPRDVKYLPAMDFTIDGKNEKVAGGNWDLDLRVFEELYVYRAYEDVFLKHRKWEDTELYNGEYQAGTTRLRNFSEMDSSELTTWKNLRCKYLSFIYKSMRELGYQQDPYSDYVTVLIGRDGKVILNNGRHRLAAAKLLGIESIPVLVDVRHKQWAKFKQMILDYARVHGGMVYAPLSHFDLRMIPARQTDRRAEVAAAIEFDSATIVDLGAQWGHMCGHLEDLGHQCVAVESDPVEFGFLKVFKSIGEHDYEICQEDICDFVERRNRFDCVLALSIFHHLAKTEVGHERLVDLLHKLDCREMIFQMPDENELQAMPAYRRYSPEEMILLIVENSCLNYCEEIGSRETRKMFHLRR